MLKEKLLELGIVFDCEYLDKYCSLIESNRIVSGDQGKTQLHHIIPRFYYVDNNLEIDNSKENIVSLLYKDHLLAHYYLYKCGVGKFKSKNLCSMSFFMGNDFISYIDHISIDCLDEIQTLYEEYVKEQSVVCGNRFRGKKQSESVIENRVRKNTGKKRSEETKKKMSAWQKGKPKSKQAIENMKIAQRKYYENAPKEEILKRVEAYKKTCANRTDEEKKNLSDKLSLAIKGRVVSDEERKHHSESLKGKPKSYSHAINIARKRSYFVYIIDDKEFLSWKEAKDYIISIGETISDSQKFKNMVDNKTYNFLKDHNIGYYRKEM